MKKSILNLTVLCLIFSSCSSEKEESIPVDLEFKGEIAQYYSVDRATVILNKIEDDIIEKYETTINFVLIRNDKPFKIDPSTYNYAGQSAVALESEPKPGRWCMSVAVKNAKYDHVGTYCGPASKIFEFCANPGDTCCLSFSTSFDDINRKGNLKDVEEFLEGKQKLTFILYGYLSESEIASEKVKEDKEDKEDKDQYIVSNYSGEKKAENTYHFIKASKYYDGEWYDSAFKEYIEGMKVGENACALGAAWCYLHEKGTPRNTKKAITILEQYAEKDAAISLFLAIFYDPTLINGNIYTGEYKERPEFNDEIYPLNNGGYGYREFYKYFIPIHSEDFGIPYNINQSIKFAEKANKILRTQGTRDYLEKLKEQANN